MDDAVSASGPICFTDHNGIQLVIPLTALKSGPGGAIDASKWPPFATLSSEDNAALVEFLKYLVANDLLGPAALPPPRAALLAKAVKAGLGGNELAIDIANVDNHVVDHHVDPNKATFDVILAYELAGVTNAS